ncbi:MAG TPA: hypothetical protein VF186_00310 [Gaiellaceae bacterium]
MAVAAGLVLSFVSALAVNWAYTREHGAANRLPPLSARRPVESIRALAGSGAWLLGFAAESGGWLVYLAALGLAPLALVQTVGASGIAVLAVVETGGHPGRLRKHEQLAVAAAVAGLVLVALSLLGTEPSDHRPAPIGAVLWLGACAGAAAVVALVRTRVSHAAALGASAGLLFAAGDISAKLLVFGGGWIVILVPLLLAYGLGSIELQSAFQHGDALSAAGIATLATNAVPIAAGVVLLHQTRPSGAANVLQLLAFGLLVLSGTLLSRPRGTARA